MSRSLADLLHDSSDRRSQNARGAFTLIELLIVVTIVGLMASVVIPAMSTTSGAVSLEAVARSVAADLRLARQAAIQYRTPFDVLFDPNNNSYQITASSSGNANNLASLLAPTASNSTIELDKFGAGRWKATRVQLGGAALKNTKARVGNLTFQPAGGTGPARTEDTVIWLIENSGADRRCVLLTVSWITGNVIVSDVQKFLPNMALPEF
jgi:general secretion pathway protein H